MTAHSRRTFLATSAGLAAGTAFLGSQLDAAAATLPAAARSAKSSKKNGSSKPLAQSGSVVYVRDAAAGTVVIMDANGEKTVVDHGLVQAIAGAGQKG